MRCYYHVLLLPRTSTLGVLCVGSALCLSVLDPLWICSELDLLYVGFLLCVTSALDLLCVLVGSALRWICSVLDLLCVGSALKLCSGSALSVLDLLFVGSALCWICSVLQQARLAFLNADIYITQPRIYVD